MWELMIQIMLESMIQYMDDSINATKKRKDSYG